jgi:hypothetical protein
MRIEIFCSKILFRYVESLRMCIKYLQLRVLKVLRYEILVLASRTKQPPLVSICEVSFSLSQGGDEEHSIGKYPWHFSKHFLCHYTDLWGSRLNQTHISSLSLGLLHEEKPNVTCINLSVWTSQTLKFTWDENPERWGAARNWSVLTQIISGFKSHSWYMKTRINCTTFVSSVPNHHDIKVEQVNKNAI